MTEINIYFDFLISVLKADGEVKQEERDYILNSAKALGVTSAELTTLENKMNGKEVDFAQILVAIKNKADPSFSMNLLKDGYSLAKSDGVVAEEEFAILKQLVNSFNNYSDDLFAELIDWCEESLYIKNIGNELILKAMEG